LDWFPYRWHTASLFAALAAVLIAIVATDLITGGHSESPPPLGTAYPTSEAVAGPRPTRTPRPPTATPHPLTPTVTPTPRPGASERDAQRRLDLERIRAALEEYYKKKDSYPSTGGNIQTLCAYEKVDAGCKLSDFLDPLPAADPLGEPLLNGYWYASDGKSFTVYALQEAPPAPDVPQCEKPEEIERAKRVFCVRSTR
jgi:hypothetical protein